MTQRRRDELLHLFNHTAPIARTFGMKLSYTDEGNAVIELPYNPALDHALGGIHGGIYATLLDSAGWFTAAAAHTISPAGWPPQRCQCTCSLPPARPRYAPSAG
ncbi:MAG TPA: PaaI family thioesterase [Candidatus Acidoferrales bacterium]|nr:PaaI family thioesterase [Candidatus Acidoferrales bacterium]